MELPSPPNTGPPLTIGPAFPGCCSRHGDSSGDALQSTHFPGFHVDVITISGIEVPLSRFAFTQGLGNYVKRELDSAQKRPVSDKKTPTAEVTVTVSPSFVCRVHITHPCSFGAQCKFAHVCPEVCQTVLVRALQQQLPASVRESFREAVAARSVPNTPNFSHGVSAAASLAASTSSIDIISRRASSNVNQPTLSYGGLGQGAGALLAGDSSIVPGTGLRAHYGGAGGTSHNIAHSYTPVMSPVQHTSSPISHVFPPPQPVVFSAPMSHHQPLAAQPVPYQGHTGFARLAPSYDTGLGSPMLHAHSSMPMASLHSNPQQMTFAMNPRGEYGAQSVLMQHLPLAMHPHPTSMLPQQHQPQQPVAGHQQLAPLPYVYADPSASGQPFYAFAAPGQNLPTGQPQSVQPPGPSYYVVMGPPPPPH